MGVAKFAGFGPGTSKFLRGLGDKLVVIAPGVRAEPRINGSSYRVDRDVRFSKDKTPYKDHIDLMFWEGEDRKRAISSLFLRIRAGGIEMGVGVHDFEKGSMARFRERVDDAKSGAALEKLVGKVEKAGLSVQGEHYKRQPKGVESHSELRVRLMRHSSLSCSYRSSLPKEFGSAAFAGWCVKHWEKMLPLNGWLVREIG